jgi:raffinose/stachyose/melibiose transport system substrate-binding protein
MQRAIEESARWFKAGYLGGKDYFSLNFDESISLVSQKKSPFFFAPSIGFQWATNYFKDATADDFGFAPIPQLDASQPYPIYDMGVAFTLSINAKSKVKDGAAMVLDRIFSPEFAAEMAKVWPGYWGIPLKQFPTDPDATGLTKSFLEAMADMTAAVDKGTFGFKIGTFFPPATSQVMFEDIESVWLDKMSAAAMLKKAETTLRRREGAGPGAGTPQAVPLAGLAPTRTAILPGRPRPPSGLRRREIDDQEVCCGTVQSDARAGACHAWRAAQGL